MLNNKQRLDLFLCENNLVKSRNLAKNMIIDGKVIVNNKTIYKPNFLVSYNDLINIIDQQKYVSRGGFKLEKAINEFKLDFKNKVVLDIGASTGGFSDCCLQNNARLVYALDVGCNQLDISLINNPRVINYENTNIKQIKDICFTLPIDVIVCDVSFISLKHVFKNIKHLLNKNLIMIFLIKPQFELNKQIINKCKAKINDPRLHNLAIENVKKYAIENSLELTKLIESPIKGNKSKNTEFLGLFKYVGD